jgi:hypothetical protein
VSPRRRIDGGGGIVQSGGVSISNVPVYLSYFGVYNRRHEIDNGEPGDAVLSDDKLDVVLSGGRFDPRETGD